MVDEDVKALGLSNRKIELLETCISMLERNDRRELATRILERYTTEHFSSAQEWRAWLNTNRGRLFFTDVGGFKFMVAPQPPPVSAKAPSGRGVEQPDTLANGLKC